MSPEKQPTVPIVIAHRGASGYLPEHTLAAYAIAILQGVDFVEPDLVMTKDGHLIARHDNVLDLTTDVACRPEFADRRTTKVVDHLEVTGWFSEDFTLQEIKRLRAIERIPARRPENVRFDGQFEIPTLEEIIYLVEALERSTGHGIGIYPETKHPTYFERLGLFMRKSLVETLRCHGYEAERKDRIFIQSFETANLKALREVTTMPLIQLLWLEGQPYDVASAGGTLSYDDMATSEGLKAIAGYADGVGPEKNHFIIPRGGDGNLEVHRTTRFVAEAHQAGLAVHAFTFRAENAFLPISLRCLDPNDPNAKGDLISEIKIFLAAGIDGFFVDQPDMGVKARAAFVAEDDEGLSPAR
ncbi:MAG: glycerophosphodiester phosphodiesterase [Gammaproteobacteria bacterium]|jgi:glycerophosphoryl diester phosphodiesterase